MVDLTRENYLTNAKLLLRGLWYADLPDLMDIEELEEAIEEVLNEIDNQNIAGYKHDVDNFILDVSGITSPPYIRSPGVEATSFFDFKKNKSLREMQIPHLLHYVSFIYNTLLEFESIFEALYIDPDNAQFVANSNSYLVFEDEFILHMYDGEEQCISAGVFTTKNNKISSSAVLAENKRRMLDAEADYLYSLKMDIESFFPNLYTHNFERMAKKSPFSSLGVDVRYFEFLDKFHQRINNNQTKGIPAGTFSSHVAAELCMLCVDDEIRSHLRKRKCNVSYVRYVDDLTFFSDSESELAELCPVVQSILNQYRLRINGHKTESIHTVYSSQPAYMNELEQMFPKLKTEEMATVLTIGDFFFIKKYAGACLKEGRSSQLRALLTMLLRKLQSEKLRIDTISTELFNFLLKLVFEDVSLTSHIYRMLEYLLCSATETAPLIEALKRKQAKIDTEYPDTILQIWHYYILFLHSSDEERNAMVSALKSQHVNPLVATAMVLPGKEKNRELYKLICDQYKQESGSTQWKKEIMNSKWWLPLFKISRYDSHDYDNLMSSENFPELLRMFQNHTAHGDDADL